MSLWQRGCNDAKEGKSREYPYQAGTVSGYTQGYDFGLRHRGYNVKLLDGTNRFFGLHVEVVVVGESFLAWRDRNMIHLAMGDDGEWEEIAVYADRLIPKISDALMTAYGFKGIDIRVVNV
jgi:hypothetical protein